MRINSKSGLSRAAFVLSVVLPFFAIARVFAQAPPPTGDSGAWGGNMDFNEIGEGATIGANAVVTRE